MDLPCGEKQARTGSTSGDVARGKIVSRSDSCYRLYKKIARAIKATVMIHRMMSLLPFFSSAIEEVQHT